MSTPEEQLSALAELVELLDRNDLGHWLFGGWAVDFHVGRVTREHDDVDLAVWQHDATAIAELLVSTGWRHAPEPDEDGGTGFERDGVRVELTYVTAGADGCIHVPLRERDVLWSEAPFGDERRELAGVRARVIPLAVLRAGKATPRDDVGDAAKDRLDYDVLTHFGD